MNVLYSGKHETVCGYVKVQGRWDNVYCEWTQHYDEDGIDMKVGTINSKNKQHLTFTDTELQAIVVAAIQSGIVRKIDLENI